MIKPENIPGEFIVRIDDGFCEWSFMLKIDNGESLSINQIWQRIRQEFNSPDHDGKLTRKMNTPIKDSTQ
jgi:hypothetical protein